MQVTDLNHLVSQQRQASARLHVLQADLPEIFAHKPRPFIHILLRQLFLLANASGGSINPA